MVEDGSRFAAPPSGAKSSGEVALRRSHLTAAAPFVVGAIAAALLALAHLSHDAGNAAFALVLSVPAGLVALGLARLAAPATAILRWDPEILELREGRRRVVIRFRDARRYLGRHGPYTLVQIRDEGGRRITIAGTSAEGARQPAQREEGTASFWLPRGARIADDLGPVLDATAFVPIASALEEEPISERREASYVAAATAAGIVGLVAHRAGAAGGIALSIAGFAALVTMALPSVIASLESLRRARAFRHAQRVERKPGAPARVSVEGRVLDLDLSEPPHDDVLLEERSEPLFVAVARGDQRGPYREHERVRASAVETASERHARHTLFGVAALHVGGVLLGGLLLTASAGRAIATLTSPPPPPDRHEPWVRLGPPPPPPEPWPLAQLPPVPPAIVEEPAAPPLLSPLGATLPADWPTPAGSRGWLWITTIPRSRVYVDGLDTGLSTPLGALEVTPGRHAIRLIGEDGSTDEVVVDVDAGETEVVLRDLRVR